VFVKQDLTRCIDIMEDATLSDDMLSGNITNKDFTLHFISVYRDMPMLWKIKSKDYMDKNKRSTAIKKMTNLLKMCRRNITEEDVKKSMLSGSGTDDIYVPSLWYYKDLEFLQDQMEGESGISSIIEQEVNSSIVYCIVFFTRTYEATLNQYKLTSDCTKNIYNAKSA
jgi:hypothetical protein